MTRSLDVSYDYYVRDVNTQSSADIVHRINVDRTSRTPLSTQIGQQVTWLIATGIIKVGSYLPVIADLADHLGVNVHTVRAAYSHLRDDGIVTMRRGSRTLVRGYDRDRVIARVKNHSSFMIGVLVPSFTDYYSEFLDAVARAAEVEGWLPVVCQTRNYRSHVVSRYMDQLFSRNVDGIIVIHFETPQDSETVEVLESSAALRPFVFVDSAELASGSRLVVDREADGFNTTQHLIEHGHRRVGYLAPPESWSSTLRLGGGYRRALTAAGLTPDSSLVAHAADFSLEAGAKAAFQLLQQDDPPTAIFCAGDILALGAISAIEILGFRVPEDVAIMGYGEIPFAALAAPSLSSVRLPAKELGYEAVRTLRRAIDDGRPQPCAAVETALIPRESCDCPWNRPRHKTAQRRQSPPTKREEVT